MEILSSEEEADIERVCMPASVTCDGIVEELFDSAVTRNDLMLFQLGDRYVGQSDVNRFVRQAPPGPTTVPGLFQWSERFLDTIKAHDEASSRRFLGNIYHLGLHTTYAGFDAPGYAVSCMSTSILGKYSIESQLTNMIGWEIEEPIQRSCNACTYTYTLNIVWGNTLFVFA